MKKQYLVTVDIPEGYTIQDMANYIRAAIKIHAGCKDPDDPIYDFDRKSVKVSPVKES